MNLKPGIAESWETKDNKTWIFTIKKGIKFHDDPAFESGKGREVTVNDVNYSLRRLMDPKGKGVVAWILKGYILGGEEFSSGKAQELKGVEILDDRKIKFTLTRPYSPFPYRLTIYATAIVPKEAVEKYGDDFGRHPVGTGPFAFKNWVADAEIELIRNPKYWEKGLPKVDRLRFVLLRDEMVAFLNFTKGELDLVNIPAPAVSSVMEEDGSVKKEYRKYVFTKNTLARTEFYVFLLISPPWKGDRLLRQALNYAIDREEIIKFVLKGRGVPANQMVPPNIWGFASNNGYQYNPDLAKELLRKSGFFKARELKQRRKTKLDFMRGKEKEKAEANSPDDEELRPVRLVADAGGDTEKIAVAVQEQLRRLGVNIKIDVVQFPQLVDLAFKGQAPIFRLYFSAIYPHPENFFFQFLRENTAPHGNNFFRYSNSEFEKLYIEATSISEKEKAESLYRKMSELIIEDAPALFLYHPEQWVLIQPYVKGLRLNGLEFFPFEKVSIER